MAASAGRRPAKTTKAKTAGAKAPAVLPTIDFYGATIPTITEDLPATFMWDLADLQNDDFGALSRLAISVIGDEGWAQARAALASVKSEDGGMSELNELLEKITEAFRTTLEK